MPGQETINAALNGFGDVTKAFKDTPAALAVAVSAYASTTAKFPPLQADVAAWGEVAGVVIGVALLLISHIVSLVGRGVGSPKGSAPTA